MLWSDVVYLGIETETVTNGEAIKSYTWAKRFANKLSIRQKEFYEARLIELKPELMFEMHSFEYTDEKKLKYKNVEYDIIRTYDRGEKVELICSKVAHG